MIPKYSRKVMQNFLHPKNMGEIKNPDGIGKVGNPICGDIMWVYIKVGHRSVYPKEGRVPLRQVGLKEGPKGKNSGAHCSVYPSTRNSRARITKEFIKNIKFKTFGCTAAIATSSMITQLAKGKSLDDAEKITRDDVAGSLKGLPPIKMHCSNLASDALKKAIEDYERKKNILK